MKTRITAALLLSSCLTLPSLADTADATAPAATGGAHENILNEVVVTAARARHENVQTTPLAITAVNSDLLERDHVVKFEQLGQLAPNIQIFHNLGTSGVADVYMRGFGENSNDPSVEPHVATLIDGVYQPDTVGNLFDMWDVCNVQVEGGPQGTIQGKNASIGAIAIDRCRANGDKFEGTIQADYGAYDKTGARFWVNAPLLRDSAGDSILAVRLVGSWKQGGNWVYDVSTNKREFGGDHERTGRLMVTFTPTDRFSWYLSADYDNNQAPQVGMEPHLTAGVPGSSSNATEGAALDFLLFGPLPMLPYGESYSTYTHRSRSDEADVFSTMTYKFDPVTATLVTAAEGYALRDNLNDGGDPFASLNAYDDDTKYDYQSAEFRLNSNKGGGWDFNGFLDWVIGAYASNFSYSNSNNLGILQGPNNFAVNVAQRQVGTAQSEAAFAHVIANFTDQWTGVFGIRRSWDQKTHAFQAGRWGNSVMKSDLPYGSNNTSVEVSTAYQFEPTKMAYVRFAQGYQAGGTAGMGNTVTFYRPELNNEYEIGFKADWLNKRLRTNLTFFVNELSQLQVESALATPGVGPGFLQEILNAGSATVEGMEAQIVAVPTEDLTTHLTLGYLHTKYNQFNGTSCSNDGNAHDCSGLPFSNAPKWTINIGADYAMDLPNGWGTAIISADWDYKATQYTTDPVYPSSKQEGYGLVNAGIKFQDPSDRYSIEFYGTNILDRHYRVAFTDPSAGAPSVAIAGWDEQGRPAEWGIRVTGKF